MYKCKIFSIGKTKEAWLQQAIEEYSRRLRPILSIEWYIAKDNIHLESLLEKPYIALDPRGTMHTSEEFSTWLTKSLESTGSRLNFVIGGADGLPSSTLNQAKEKVSFSKLTFTHQITRLILLEQLYRAFEIEKGTKYHK